MFERYRRLVYLLANWLVFIDLRAMACSCKCIRHECVCMMMQLCLPGRLAQFNSPSPWSPHLHSEWQVAFEQAADSDTIAARWSTASTASESELKWLTEVALAEQTKWPDWKEKEPFDCRLRETAFTIASSHSHTHMNWLYTHSSVHPWSGDENWIFDGETGLLSLHLHSTRRLDQEPWEEVTVTFPSVAHLPALKSLLLLSSLLFSSLLSSAPRLSSPFFLRVLQLLLNFYYTCTPTKSCEYSDSTKSSLFIAVHLTLHDQQQQQQRLCLLSCICSPLPFISSTFHSLPLLLLREQAHLSSPEMAMISRRKIISRSQSELDYPHNVYDVDEDVWFSKDKLFQVSRAPFFPSFPPLPQCLMKVQSLLPQSSSSHPI